jgi:hypothetical protein
MKLMGDEQNEQNQQYEIRCCAECAEDREMAFARITDINIGRRNY